MIFGRIYATAERAGRPMSFPDAQLRRRRVSMARHWRHVISVISRQPGCGWSIRGRGRRVLTDSDRCSRFNQKTERLRASVFEAVFARG